MPIINGHNQGLAEQQQLNQSEVVQHKAGLHCPELSGNSLSNWQSFYSVFTSYELQLQHQFPKKFPLLLK